MIDIIEIKCSDADARLWEIAENLHRAELTQLQRKEQIAEWIKLTDENLQSAGVRQIEDSGRTPATIIRGPGMPEGGINVDAKLWEIAENLHRAELTQLQRDGQLALWIELTNEKNIGANCADIPQGRGRPNGGVNAAARELGVKRTDVQSRQVAANESKRADG
jgi:hypothetical protein